MISEQLHRSILWNSLTNLGSYVKLNISINENEVLDQLHQFNNNWCPYNTQDNNVNRWGLPITSKSGDVMDNCHIENYSYLQDYHNLDINEGEFVVPTDVYYSIPEFKKVVDIFSPDIGRVHLLKVNKGGYFPPHRDFTGYSPKYFRIICVFGSCTETDYVQMLNDQPFRPSSANLYFVNFQLNHSVFSFSDGLYNLIVTVKLTERTHDLILKYSGQSTL